MTTKKRRAQAGERPFLNYDVIVYAPENWLYRNRITVRDKQTGCIEEQRGYVVSWAVARAVSRLIGQEPKGSHIATTSRAVPHTHTPTITEVPPSPENVP